MHMFENAYIIVKTRLGNCSADSDFIDVPSHHGPLTVDYWCLTLSHLVPLYCKSYGEWNSRTLNCSAVASLRYTYHSSTFCQHDILRRYGVHACWSRKLPMPAREILEERSLPSFAMCSILTCMRLKSECQLINDGMNSIPHFIPATVSTNQTAQSQMLSDGYSSLPQIQVRHRCNSFPRYTPCGNRLFFLNSLR